MINLIFLIVFSSLEVSVIIAFFMGNNGLFGILGLIVSSFILLPLIAKNAFEYYRYRAEKKNWERYQEKHGNK